MQAQKQTEEAMQAAKRRAAALVKKWRDAEEEAKSKSKNQIKNK